MKANTLVDGVYNTDLVRTNFRLLCETGSGPCRHPYTVRSASLHFFSCGLRLSWLFSIEKLKIASYENIDLRIYTCNTRGCSADLAQESDQYKSRKTKEVKVKLVLVKLPVKDLESLSSKKKKKLFQNEFLFFFLCKNGESKGLMTES